MMTDGMIGADPTALRALAQTMSVSGISLSTIDQQVSAVLGRVGWQGQDAQRFRSEWNSSIRPKLQDSASLLREKSRVLLADADEQDTASDQGGGANGQSPAGGGGTGAAGQNQDTLLETLAGWGGDLGAWPPFQLGALATSTAGFGAERLLNAMRNANLLTTTLGQMPEVGYIRGTQSLNALRIAGNAAAGLGILTGAAQAYEGFQSGDGHAVADGTITAILAGGSIAPTPAAPFFAAASLVWAGAQILSGDVPVTERITDFAGDAVDTLGEAGESVSDAAEDAWNWAFG
ncbi:hypothetical protein GM708_07100 [Vibrio cholerae]|jgi:uncharacterized protein YukE|nr:hypothetical protein [Vibrio cholerae]